MNSENVKRFWKHVTRGHAAACWVWTGATRKGGYGAFRVGSRSDGTRRKVSAHRAAWELAHGEPFPQGKLALHSCDNPACCNPRHIRPGTPSENARDRVERRGR